VRQHKSSITLDLQKLNRAFNILNSKDVSYKIPDPTKCGMSNLDLTEGFSMPTELPNIGYQELGNNNNNKSMTKTRKSSFNSISGTDLFDFMPDFPNPLSRNLSFEFRNMM
jgi:hypothetical protein